MTCCTHTCREGRDCPRRRAASNPFAPLIREIKVRFYQWARHDLQHKNPAHPDLPEVIQRLRELEAGRG